MKEIKTFSFRCCIESTPAVSLQLSVILPWSIAFASIEWPSSGAQLSSGHRGNLRGGTSISHHRSVKMQTRDLCIQQLRGEHTILLLTPHPPLPFSLMSQGMDILTPSIKQRRGQSSYLHLDNVSQFPWFSLMEDYIIHPYGDNSHISNHAEKRGQYGQS